MLIWQPDRWMARTALVDLQRDVLSKYNTAQVAVVGVAVHQSADQLRETLQATGASFPHLHDSDGEILVAVGSTALPRIYVLDPSGEIVWFDIEYSESSRRELDQTLATLTQSK